MAKKTTRQRKELAQQRAIQQAAANVAMGSARIETPAAQPAAAVTPASPARAARVAETGEEYKYVSSDLKRIALLALSITAVLIVLSFLM